MRPCELIYLVWQTLKPSDSNVWRQNLSIRGLPTSCFGSNTSLLYLFIYFFVFLFVVVFVCLVGLFFSTFTFFSSLVMKWDLSLRQGDQVGLFFSYVILIRFILLYLIILLHLSEHWVKIRLLICQPVFFKTFQSSICKLANIITSIIT